MAIGLRPLRPTVRAWHMVRKVSELGEFLIRERACHTSGGR